ncbi:hypothetical protein J31TS4_12290 [Paenibacillus sp. J31TS4]|uniref:GNAT family N-acetyltransferase n=1 Tax=Paenibacillus sp. J31TS4 TaxID=2807195 RepID=UPI001B2A0FE6|nr:GNAT family N-acetyltransferase [Paenibacillus sp. J31TS4]GIP37949.1 hypothetical protein J31TS4_12290 [Paenibacillus sp. J31TS4]
MNVPQSDSPWRIVPAGATQLPLLTELYEEAARWQASRSPVHWPLECRENWTPDVERGYVHLLEEKATGAVAGMVILYPDPEPFDRSIWPDPEASAAYLHKLIVRRTWEGQGLGELLLDWAEAECRRMGKRLLRLDCMGDNEGLNRYYPRAGFTYRGQTIGKGWKANRYEREVREHLVSSPV